MSKKMMLLATALTALAFAAIPAVASAGAPETHCPEAKASCSFSITFPTFRWNTTSGESTHCSSGTGTGTMGTTTGNMTIVYHGCTESVFGSACTTAGKPSGTIETTALTYHNIYATDGKTKPATLITPNATSGIFAHYTCFGGLVTKTIHGNGLIGTLSSPACGGAANAYKESFEQSINGHQKHTQITGTGTVYDLTDGSTTISLNATMEFKFSGAVSLTCV